MPLIGAFDSQIAGGKRYDLAAAGRKRANATFLDSHAVDRATAVEYAMDLTPLVRDPTLDVTRWTLQLVERSPRMWKPGSQHGGLLSPRRRTLRWPRRASFPGSWQESPARSWARHRRLRERVYAGLALAHHNHALDFSRVTTFNLDEYVGLSRSHPASFHAFMEEHFLSRVNADRRRVHLPPTEGDDLAGLA